MQEQIKAWAAKFGLRTEQVEAGIGALLGFIQSKVPAAQWQQLQGALPQAQQWVEKARAMPAAASGAASGLMGQAMGMLGKLSGSAQGGAAQMLGQLQQAGFSPDKAMGFASEVVGQIKSTVGKDKFDNLMQVAPGLKDALGGLGKFINKP